MPDIIHLLPDSVANQIAAGEVIQRPASVVKELVENSLDAGATKIDVLITDAGKTCIQVVDNGSGMSETDARLAFERHATSKINKATDLCSLRTMGFRGEALPSIAAVAQMELRTRTADNTLGVELRIEASRVVDQQPVACDKGANFMVKNLFVNIPARRRFLKSNQTEFNNILLEFEKIALAHPDIRFTLYNNDTVVFDLLEGPMLRRISDIFGKRMNQQLLHFGVETGIVNIKGYVGTPESARKKGSKQFFFVNGRYMRHPYFSRAVMLAYERLIPADEQVSFFIYFDIDPGRIDVNIHPTKAEIKFDDEQAVFQILMAAVKEAVGKFSAVPEIDFGVEDKPDIPPYNPNDKPSAPPEINYSPSYNPFASTPAGHGSTAPRSWQRLFEDIKRQHAPSGQTAPDEAPTLSLMDSKESEWAGRSPEQYQYKQKYIITSIQSGLMIVDQHRAMMRVLYERYLGMLASHKVKSERIIFPELIRLTPAERSALAQHADDITAAGFDLSDLGDDNFAINALPAGTTGVNAKDLLRDVLSETMSAGEIQEEVNRRIALSLARDAALPYGKALTREEMGKIIGELFASSSPKYTPDGKLIVAIIPDSKIDSFFS